MNSSRFSSRVSAAVAFALAALALAPGVAMAQSPYERVPAKGHESGWATMKATGEALVPAPPPSPTLAPAPATASVPPAGPKLGLTKAQPAVKVESGPAVAKFAPRNETLPTVRVKADSEEARALEGATGNPLPGLPAEPAQKPKHSPVAEPVKAEPAPPVVSAPVQPRATPSKERLAPPRLPSTPASLPLPPLVLPPPIPGAAPAADVTRLLGVPAPPSAESRTLSRRSACSPAREDLVVSLTPTSPRTELKLFSADRNCILAVSSNSEWLDVVSAGTNRLRFTGRVSELTAPRSTVVTIVYGASESLDIEVRQTPDSPPTKRRRGR